MIFFDTETTGLIKKGIQDPNKQPRIIEIGLILATDEGETRAMYTTLLNPGEPLSPIITKITKLTDADLVNAPTFPEVLPELIAFFRRSNVLVAHNLEFDLGMLVFELRRIGWEHRFPYPSEHIDTVPLCGGKSLANWSEEVLEKGLEPQTHRALGDAQRLVACWKTLAK